MTTFPIPPMIIRSTERLSDVEASRIRHAYQSWLDGVQNGLRPLLVLDKGLELIPLQPAAVVPDAFCRYCGVANLRSSVWCQACGAPLIREVQ